MTTTSPFNVPWLVFNIQKTLHPSTAQDYEA